MTAPTDDSGADWLTDPSEPPEAARAGRAHPAVRWGGAAVLVLVFAYFIWRAAT